VNQCQSNNTFIKIMHYILNTSFIVQENPKSTVKIGGPTRFNINTDAPKLTQSKFVPGQMYTLTYIKKVPDGVEYTFKSSSGEVIVEKFASCNDADNFIAATKGEKLPNYNQIYSKLRA